MCIGWVVFLFWIINIDRIKSCQVDNHNYWIDHQQWKWNLYRKVQINQLLFGIWINSHNDSGVLWLYKNIFVVIANHTHKICNNRKNAKFVIHHLFTNKIEWWIPNNQYSQKCVFWLMRCHKWRYFQSNVHTLWSSYQPISFSL